MNEIEWLRRLLLELERELPRIQRLRRYARNQPDLPEMGEKLRASWERFQQEASTNWAGLISEPIVERVIPNAITVEGSPEVETRVRQIWRDNHMDALFPDMTTDMFDTSVGYLMVTRGEDGRAQITVENPEQVVTIQDPVRPWRSVAGLKLWRDRLAGRDYCFVWHDGRRVQWTREAREDGGAWRGLDIPIVRNTPASSWRFVEGSIIEEKIPLRRFDNRGGRGEFEIHIPVIDRINRGILSRLVIVSMQAYRQRALRSKDTNETTLPEVDAQGNDIDYGEIFEPAPGALWELPPGVDVWESQSADIHGILASETADIKQLSAASRTPLTAFMPETANQSAEGAALAREGLVSKAQDRIKRIRPNLEAVLVQALALEGYEVEGTLKVEFEPPQMVSLAEKYDAASKAHAIGESLESIQRNILGYSQPQIDKDRQARAKEALTLGLQLPRREVGAADEAGGVA